MEKIRILVPAQISISPNKALASSASMQAEPDLMYMDSVLVSTGENLNDDVFLPQEMWNARKSPKLKPVDWEHETGSEIPEEEFSKNPRHPINGNQIIGVMYNSYATDENGVTITEDKASAKDFVVPEKFNIVDQSVIYKSLFPKTAAKIEKGAKENTLFVSMEAWFPNYDYLVGNKIIARNEQTAFLDKSLRARGGNGVMGDLKVKRILRDITFGGKGIVYRPANQNSIIKSVTSEPVQVSASEVYNQKAIASNIIGEINPEGKAIQKELVMGDENKTIQPVVLAGLTVEDYKGAVTKASQLELSVKAKDEEIATLKSKAEQTAKAASDALATEKAKSDELSKKLAEAEGKLAQAAKDKVVADRRSKLASELKAEGEKLEKLVTITKNFDEETFASYISSTKELLSMSQATVDAAKKKEDDAKAAEVTAKAEADKKLATEAAAKAAGDKTVVEISDPKILEKIKASVAPSPGVDNGNKGVDLKVAYANLATAIVGAGKRE
jgi:hypothetical protein